MRLPDSCAGNSTARTDAAVVANDGQRVDVVLNDDEAILEAPQSRRRAHISRQTFGRRARNEAARAR